LSAEAGDLYTSKKLQFTFGIYEMFGTPEQNMFTSVKVTKAQFWVVARLQSSRFLLPAVGPYFKLQSSKIISACNEKTSLFQPGLLNIQYFLPCGLLSESLTYVSFTQP
jgi:hypothetical protein